MGAFFRHWRVDRKAVALRLPQVVVVDRESSAQVSGHGAARQRLSWDPSIINTSKMWFSAVLNEIVTKESSSSKPEGVVNHALEIGIWSPRHTFPFRQDVELLVLPAAKRMQNQPKLVSRRTARILLAAKRIPRDSVLAAHNSNGM